MLPGAEAFAGNGRHVRFTKQSAGKIGSRFDSAASKEGRNVGIGVERAFRHRALHSRDRAQTADHMVAQLDVLQAHFLDALLRSVQRRHRGLLHDGRRIRGGLALQFLHRRHHGSRRQRVTETPSRSWHRSWTANPR